MSETKPVEKDHKPSDGSVLAGLSLDQTTGAVSKFRAEATEKKKPETITPKTEAVNWRSELQNATTEIKKLEQLKTGDPASDKQRKDLIESIDKHFQKALPLVAHDAKSADGELLTNVARANASEKDFQSFKVKDQTINPNTAKMDEIHNAILNAPDDATRKQLTRLAVLAETRDVAVTKVDESYWKTKAPMMAALDYANFLTKYKDGITQNSEGKIITASGVLNGSMSQEIAASPQGKVLLRLAGDCSPLLPAEKNPFLALEDAKSEQDPKKALEKLKHAADLANDPYFDRDNLKKLADNIAKNDDSPAAKAQLNALNEFTHARGVTEATLGLDQVVNGQNKEAVGHLLNAAKDPRAAEFVAGTDGKTSFNNVLMAAMMGNDPNLAKADETFSKATKETMAHYNQYENLKDTNGDAAAKELKLASDSVDQALANARAIKNSIGEDNAKKIKEEFAALDKKDPNSMSPEDRMMQQTLKPLVDVLSYESDALYKKAKIDNESRNHNSAVSDLEALQKLDPAFVSNQQIKPDFDNEMQKAKDGAEYDNSSWLGKSWLFAKKHEKIAAAGVALVGAAAITFGTAGAGAPIGAAIVAGVIGGTIAGTTLGAEAEVHSGDAKDLWSGVKDVAPSAFAGAATGALLIGAAPVGAATLEGAAPVTEGAAALEGEAGTQSSSFLIRGIKAVTTNFQKFNSFERLPLPGTQGLYDLAGGGRLGSFAANSLRTAEIAAPYSLTNSFEKYKSGEDKTFGAAAYDFAKTDLEFGLAGGLTKTPWLTGTITRPALGAIGLGVNTAFQTYMVAGSYLTSGPLSTRFDKNSVTLPEGTDPNQNQDQPDQ